MDDLEAQKARLSRTQTVFVDSPAPPHYSSWDMGNVVQM